MKLKRIKIRLYSDLMQAVKIIIFTLGEHIVD